MKLLLDTHTWLWWLGDPEQLDAEARHAISRARQPGRRQCRDLWEVAIKRSSTRLRPARLPPHHRDPFDRMLIAQAQIEGLTVVTRDPSFGPTRSP